MESSEFEQLSPEQQAKVRQMVAELDELFAAGEASQKRMDAFSKEMVAAAKTAINCHFPEVMNLESKGYRLLDEAIYQNLLRLTSEVDTIVFHNRFQ